jgi:hypothetical protein
MSEYCRKLPVEINRNKKGSVSRAVTAAVTHLPVGEEFTTTTLHKQTPIPKTKQAIRVLPKMACVEQTGYHGQAYIFQRKVDVRRKVFEAAQNWAEDRTYTLALPEICRSCPLMENNGPGCEIREDFISQARALKNALS